MSDEAKAVPVPGLPSKGEGQRKGLLAWGQWQHDRLLAALAVLALALRLWNIAAQSFWYDEGCTTWVVRQSWPGIVDLLARNNHAPLYFALVKLWVGVLGQSDLAYRSFSVVWGVATVGVVVALGRRLFNLWVASLAAFLVTISPALVTQAQEARMYALESFLVSSGSYALLRLWQSECRLPRRWWGVYVLSMAGAVYTHHLAWLAFAGQAPFLLVLAIRRRRMWPLMAGLAVIGLYLPWLPITLRQLAVARSLVSRPLTTPRAALQDLWAFLNLGNSWNRAPLVPATVGAACLALAGTGLSWRWARQGWLLLPAGLALPVIAIAVVQTRVPLYTDRYLLYLAPLLYLLIAAGIWTVSQIIPSAMVRARVALSIILFATVAYPMGRELLRYYQGRGMLRSDYRGVAAFLTKATRPGDALALVNTAQPILHYYSKDLPWASFPGIYAEDYVTTEEEVIRNLQAMAQPGSVVWYVGSQTDIADPQDLVEAQLREHATLWYEQHWQQSAGQTPIRVAAYAVREPFAPEPQIPVGAVFGPFDLAAYDTQTDLKGNLFVALWWKCTAPPWSGYAVSVEAIDSSGNVLASDSHVAVNPFYPMSRWKPGQSWRDEHCLALPQGVNACDLSLRVSLRSGASGEPAQMTAGPWQGQTSVVLAAWPRAAESAAPTPRVEDPLPAIPSPLRATLGGQIEFLGYDLRETAIDPGGKLHLILYWRALKPAQTSYTVFTHLLDAGAVIRGQWDSIPVQSQRPTTSWRVGEIVADPYEIPVFAHAQPGPHQLEIGLYDLQTGARLPVLQNGKPAEGDRILLPVAVTVRQ